MISLDIRMIDVFIFLSIMAISIGGAVGIGQRFSEINSQLDRIEELSNIEIPEVNVECPECPDFNIILTQDGISWTIVIEDKNVVRFY